MLAITPKPSTMMTNTAVYASRSNKNGKIEFIRLWLQSVLEYKCVKPILAMPVLPLGAKYLGMLTYL
jgi:hypothetical protein